VRAVQQLDMQIATKFSRERPPEMFDKLDVKLSNAFAHFRDSIDEEGAATQIHYGADQSFIHRHISRAEADNSFLIAERIGERLANRQRDVFYGVMSINVQITFAFNFEIEQTVARKQLEHVIEKADSGSDLRVTSPIEIELHADISLASRSLFVCGPGHRVLRAVEVPYYLIFTTGWSGCAGLGTKRRFVQSTKRSSTSRTVWPIITSSPRTRVSS